MDIKEKYEAYISTGFVAAVEPIVIEHAKGAVYYDENDISYIDCFSGISVTNTGHGNEEVNNAAKEQIDKLVHCCSYVYHNRPVADLAERIAQITPGRLKKSFFGNSGAEAIEGAFRLARRYTCKNEAIALTHSFHGRSYATLSVTGNSSRKRGGGPYMPGVSFLPSPYCYRCSFNMSNPEKCGMVCAEYLADVIRYYTSDNVAFFIAEPIMGEGGIIPPPKGYFRIIKQILEENEILFIADEVQTGFCRTGKMFAIQHYNVEPDIITMAKGIANGFPLSCFITSDEISDSFKPGDHLSTFGGNPVSCAASLANIDFMEKNSIADESDKKGAILQDALRKIKPRWVAIGDIRGKGLMIGIELVEDVDTKIPATKQAGKIRAALREKGVLIGVGGVFGNVLRIQPPLIIEEEKLQKVIKVFKEVLES